jgi:predicted metal-binding protein
VLVATNLYQTSSSDVPAHATCGDCVANAVVPVAVTVQVVAELTATAIAPAQLLLAGCAYAAVENNMRTNKYLKANPQRIAINIEERWRRDSAHKLWLVSMWY